jgi:hypothetical protein
VVSGDMNVAARMIYLVDLGDMNVAYAVARLIFRTSPLFVIKPKKKGNVNILQGFFFINFSRQNENLRVE